MLPSSKVSAWGWSRRAEGEGSSAPLPEHLAIRSPRGWKSSLHFYFLYLYYVYLYVKKINLFLIFRNNLPFSSYKETDLYFGSVLPEVCSSALLACACLDPQACGWALAQSQSYCLWKPLLLVAVHWLIGSMSYAPLPPSPRFVRAACFLCPVSWATSSRQR